MGNYLEIFKSIRSTVSGQYRVEEQDIRMAEQLFNFLLPQDYKRFLLTFGCGVLCKQIYFSGIFDRRYGAELSERIGYMAEYQLLAKESLFIACEDHWQVEKYERPLPIIENSYMFADHVSGATFFFERDTIRSDHYDLLLLEDDGPLHFIGNSFTEFIVKFCNNEYYEYFKETVKDIVFDERLS